MQRKNSKKRQKPNLLPGNLFCFFQLSCLKGGIAWRKIPLWLLYAFRLGFLLPLGCLERLIYAGRIEDTKIADAPVFILGHQRSGTTLLQKLFSNDPGLGYLRNQDMFFPFYVPMVRNWIRIIFDRFIRIFGVRNVFFRDLILDLEDPTEEEMAMAGLPTRYSVYTGILFPKNARHYLEKFTKFQQVQDREAWTKAYLYQLKKLTLIEEGKPLILKNPPHLARIPLLLELFPNARFVHIRRHPVDVFFSMKNLWEQVLQKYFTLQTIGQEELHEFILFQYRWLAIHYEHDKHLIPRGRLVEIRYEDLRKNPLSMMEHIYKSLEIPGFQEAKQFIDARIRREKQYQTFSWSRDPVMESRIRKSCEDLIKLQGYT